MDIEKRARIVELWHDGLNGPQIAREMGLGSTGVYRVLKAAGISPSNAVRSHERPGNRSNTAEQEREILRRYQDGETMVALGVAFGCHLATIANVLRRHGVSPRKPGGVVRHATREEADDILRRWRAGESQTAIGASLGMSQNQVSHLLALHGLTKEHRHARGPSHGLWKGGRTINRAGYVFVRVEADDPLAAMRTTTGYVMEHRVVMARHLGRPLQSWETVHHLNGDRADNRLDNLQLRTGKHGRGVVMCCADCGSTNIVQQAVR